MAAMAVDSLRKQGQDLYRQKAYEGALRCFDKAIEEQDQPNIGLLDNRSATYTKLGDLPAALEDGRQMIKLARANITGYLRTGQILQLMGKNETALGIYKYGLRNVPVSNTQIKLLQGMHNQLNVKFSPESAIDPLEILPAELMVMIIAYLEFNTIVSLLRVSKEWRQYIESVPSFWDDLDFSRARKRVRFSTIKAYVDRSKKRVDRAVLSRFGDDINEILQYMTVRCKSLRHLEIRQGLANASLERAVPLAINLTTLIVGIDSVIALEQIGFMLAQCKRLEVAEFHKARPSKSGLIGPVVHNWTGELPTMRRLRITAGGNIACAIGLPSLLRTIPNIRELELQDWSFTVREPSPDFMPCPNLERLDLSLSLLDRAPLTPPTLTSLDLTSCHPSNARQGISLDFTQSTYNNLTNLSLGKVRNIKIEQVHRILEHNAGNIQILDIAGCDIDDRQGPILDSTHDERESFDLMRLIVSSSCRNLTDLNLSYTAANDESAQAIANHLSKLKVLDMSYTQITGVGIKALAFKGGDQIAKLTLVQCAGVSIDAVQFAREKGIFVKYSFPNNLKYGKRIRLC